MRRDDWAAFDAGAGRCDTEDASSSGYDAEDVHSCGEAPSIGCATKSDALMQSQTFIAVLETPHRAHPAASPAFAPKIQLIEQARLALAQGRYAALPGADLFPSALP